MFWIKIKNLQTEIVSKILKLIVCCLELLSDVHNDGANFNHKMNIQQSATNDAKIVLPLLINYWCLMVDQVWLLFPAVTFLPFQQLECGLKLNILQADPEPGEDWPFIHYEHSAGIMPGKTVYGCERVFLIRQFFICEIILIQRDIKEITDIKKCFSINNYSIILQPTHFLTSLLFSSV